MIVHWLEHWIATAPIAEAVFLAFAFWLGATIGSFLNVVVHRLPRRESLVFGGSHCPRCRAAIRARDNIPVAGWLLLGGRCRDCREPIASRYPLVEAATGVAVMAVFAADILGRTTTGRPGIDGLFFGQSWPAVAAWALHSWLAVTWIAWILLAWDGNAIPGVWLWPTVAAAVGVAAWWPAVGLAPGILTAAAPLVLVAVSRCVRRP